MIESSISMNMNRNFTSPHTLRVEVGLANEMEQYDKNFKIRQLMGEVNTVT